MQLTITMIRLIDCLSISNINWLINTYHLYTRSEGRSGYIILRGIILFRQIIPQAEVKQAKIQEK